MNESTKKSIIIGVFFLILFTAYASFSTIITQIHQQDGLNSLGPALLAVNYFAFMISNIFAPGFTWKFSKLMAIAAIGYAINFSSGLLLDFLPVFMKYAVTLLGAAIAGTGSATLWTCLGGYIHLVCQKNDEIANKGKYYGIFSAIYCAQSILGAFITTFGLGLFSTNVYFAIIGSIGLSSSLFCFLLVKDVQTDQDMRKKAKFNALKSAKQLFSFYPQMKHTLPLIFLDGLIIGFINSSLTHFIPKSDSNHQANIRAGIGLFAMELVLSQVDIQVEFSATNCLQKFLVTLMLYALFFQQAFQCMEHLFKITIMLVFYSFSGVLLFIISKHGCQLLAQDFIMANFNLFRQINNFILLLLQFMKLQVFLHKTRFN